MGGTMARRRQDEKKKAMQLKQKKTQTEIPQKISNQKLRGKK